MQFLNPIATNTQNPIDGMYKRRSAKTNPTCKICDAGIYETIIHARAVITSL